MLEIVGWIGSILVVLSLTQAKVWRFRVLNLVGSVLATGYNAIIGIWPFAAMNGAIAIINVYWLLRLERERHDAGTYQVIEVEPDDRYLAHVLDVHARDIHDFAPGFDWRSPAPGRSTFLIMRGDETVGVVAVRDVGDGVGRVELDFVTERFRDFTPGEFVYRRSDIFTGRGFTRLLAPTGLAGSGDYYRRMGFAPDSEEWVLDLAPVTR